MSFETFLQEQLGKHDCTQIEQLLLDELFTIENGIFTNEHKTTLEKYINLQHLSCQNIGLKLLKNMPHLPNLKVLELQDNQLIGNDLNEIVDLYPNLYKLNLQNNKISSYEYLQPLVKFPKIQKINLTNNPLSEKRDYKRDKIYEIIPQLIVVDKQDQDGNDVESTIDDEEDEDEIDDIPSDYEEEEEFNEEEYDEDDDEDDDED
jgi:Leucine-rich repeat (LRR) protein